MCMRESWHQCLPCSCPLWCKLQISYIENLLIHFGRWTFWETGRDTWSFKQSLQEPSSSILELLTPLNVGGNRTKGSYLGHFKPKLKPNCWRSHTFLWGRSSRHAWYTCLVRSASCKNKAVLNTLFTAEITLNLNPAMTAKLRMVSKSSWLETRVLIYLVCTIQRW